MTQSHRSLVRSFERGETTGRSSSMSIMQHNDMTLLVGYGHAVYAVRRADGTIVRFDGWYFKQCRPRARTGSTTVKSNHWPAVRGVGDVRVPYNTPRTDSEHDLARKLAGQDWIVRTDDAKRAAPRLHDDWMDTTLWALEEADEL